MVWEAKRVTFYPKTAEGDPAQPGHLVVAHNALDRAEVSIREQRTSRDPVGDVAEGGVQPLAGGACFEDEKTELGFDHYEGRNYTGLLRHQLVTAVSHLFLARVQRGERARIRT